MRSPRYFGLLLDLGELAATLSQRPSLAKPALVFAEGLLGQRYRVLRRRAKQVVAQSPPSRHAVRIAAKKMRYAAEIFASLFDDRTTLRFLRSLSRLQDVLGVLNDLRVARQRVAMLAAHASTDTTHAEGFLHGWWAAQEASHLDRLDRRWKKVKRARIFWSADAKA